ncbi:MAG: T9SS type A sorting domain-containing protein [Bacteroidales bacterium]|jgi:hypothetical protein|nr:T9SS type A sorting domain-containing protein [Bacteroidales bacterium]
MKKILLLLAVMLLFIADSYSQASFNTGAMEIAVNQYGRIRLFTPDGTRHLQRASILVGTSATSVFDYTNDAGELEPTVLVSNPLISDYEIYGAYDNSYSSLPPAIIEKLNAYGWNNGAYAIIKLNVKNIETSNINASIGLDIIPELNQEYGYDSVTYNSEAGVIWFHRGNQETMGMKLLSASLSSLYSFEWFTDYSTDANYWNWLNHGSLQSEYISTTADGPVTITSQSPVVLGPGVSCDVFYAMALGADEETMLANIAAAEQKYYIITGVEDKELSANELNLGQNSPNPFNQSTTIRYQLPDNGFVSLKVYNSIGNEVATLVNTKQTKGSYTVHFDASGLSGGMYYYKLSCNDMVKSNKMLLVK